jgi:hypothetical protein
MSELRKIAVGICLRRQLQPESLLSGIAYMCNSPEIALRFLFALTGMVSLHSISKMSRIPFRHQLECIVSSEYLQWRNQPTLDSPGQLQPETTQKNMVAPSYTIQCEPTGRENSFSSPRHSVQSKLEQNSLLAKGGKPSVTVTEYCKRRLQSIFELTDSKVVYSVCHQNEHD